MEHRKPIEQLDAYDDLDLHDGPHIGSLIDREELADAVIPASEIYAIMCEHGDFTSGKDAVRAWSKLNQTIIDAVKRAKALNS